MSELRSEGCETGPSEVCLMEKKQKIFHQPVVLMALTCRTHHCVPLAFCGEEGVCASSSPLSEEKHSNFKTHTHSFTFLTCWKSTTELKNETLCFLRFVFSSSDSSVCLCASVVRLGLWWTENNTKVKTAAARRYATNTTHTHTHTLTVVPCVYKHSGFLLGTVTAKIKRYRRYKNTVGQ